MGSLAKLYATPLTLLTDLYQLTMAYGYWKTGMQSQQAVFHLFFRRAPFDGGYAIACGIETAVEWLAGLRFTSADLNYLSELSGSDGRPLFTPEFLKALEAWQFDCDVAAVREGTAVFPHEPLMRVTGPLLSAQLVETGLLTLINFPTLIATKAARICDAADGDAVIEFGLRRAQGIDGGVTASRAAYVGGCDATSNVLAGQLFGIPVKGTHAHSWVMAHGDEQLAFDRYADAMPNNSVLLVDTYDTRVGIERAIRTAKRLRAAGHELLGIRLDSGDLAQWSILARKMLDEAGFPQARIVASSDLDEYEITDLKRRGARIDIWGVGTRLATAYDQPALGGVYKLGGIRGPDGSWAFRVTRSAEPAKSTNPGILQVRRFVRDGRFFADVLYNEAAPPNDWTAVPLTDATKEADAGTKGRSTAPRDVGTSNEVPDTLAPDASADSHFDLLEPIMRGGEPIGSPTPLRDVRATADRNRSALPPDVRRLRNAVPFPVGLHRDVFEQKQRLLNAARLDSGTN